MGKRVEVAPPATTRGRGDPLRQWWRRDFLTVRVTLLDDDSPNAFEPRK
jgi:hypothetical protein